ncbi:hypothetical protein BKA67DRAFT_662532 [Truncatella angustata]|uniref:Uncharacterized protein n=1 Tax=Truncatella angustata TaxID=152316 RepID=A0A9P8RKK4_9PEZI|nr:uncharacterized protein BKA67DRAFT_662532 [Truncatella angustata]KAH6647770.1 hypothetical protein BKA67DRAFT_662532 [Truncatella angustata]
MLDLRTAAALVARGYGSSSSIAKREEYKSTIDLDSAWFIAFAIINIAVFLPVLQYISYTLGAVFPTLAFVECKPTYERISSKEEDEVKGDTKSRGGSIEELDSTEFKPITSSIRATHRLLWSIGGFRALFRGLLCLWATTLVYCVLVLGLYQIPAVPKFFDNLLARLLTLQLQAFWVHSVLSTGNRTSAWKRIPGFKQTIQATAVPSFIAIAATFFADLIPMLAMLLLHVRVYQPHGLLPSVPVHDAALWELGVFLFLRILMAALIEIPSQVVLVRCQTSLMSDADKTIIAVDRTFGVEEVRERGYLSILEAFKSLKGTWGRLCKFWVKLLFLTIAIQVTAASVIVAEFLGLVLYASLSQRGQ